MSKRHEKSGPVGRCKDEESAAAFLAMADFLNQNFKKKGENDGYGDYFKKGINSDI